MRRILIVSLLLIQSVLGFSFDKQAISFKKIPFRESLPNSIVKRVFRTQKGLSGWVLKQVSVDTMGINLSL